MWDQNTGRSRGYGFVAFRNKEDAERALSEMNGEWLGSRAIRCNWANQKISGIPSVPSMGGDPSSDANISPSNTTVYVGNLTPDVTDALLRTFFNDFGPIEEIRMQKDKGFAFIRFQSHDGAKDSIASMHGKVIGMRSVKCSWGKERSGGSTTPAPRTQSMSPPYGGGYPPMSYAPYPAIPTGPYGMTAQPYPAYGAPPYGMYPPPYPSGPMYNTSSQGYDQNYGYSPAHQFDGNSK